MKKENAKGVTYYQSMRTRYLNYAKEASASGDRVLYEYNLQFAEHYGRLIDSKINRPLGEQNEGARNTAGAATATQSVGTAADGDDATEQTNNSRRQPDKRRVMRRQPKPRAAPSGETLS
jgi:hypothetical protein